MKNRRYIFTPYQNLSRTRFSRLKKICDRLTILVKRDEQIAASIVVKTHKMGKKLKWVYLKELGNSNMHYHWMYLLGKADAKADEDIEFVLLSNNEELDSIVKRLNEGGRKCLRISLQEEDEKKAKEIAEVSATKMEAVIRPEAKPKRRGLRAVSEDTIIQDSARITVQKLQSSGERPENLEKLKHYIHLFSASPGGRKVSIDQILDYMEAQREISVHQGVVTYNF